MAVSAGKLDGKSTTASRFKWKDQGREEILKDVIIKLGDFSDSLMNAAKIAKELREKYQIEVTAATVRAKLRLVSFKKWLDQQKKNNGGPPGGKKRKRVESNKSEEDDDDDDDEEVSFSMCEDDDTEEDIEFVEKEKIGHSQYPKFWIIEDSDECWFFFRRCFKMRVEHKLGETHLTVIYTVEPPSVIEIRNLLTKCIDVPSLKRLNIENKNIQNQIKNWKLVSWRVAVPTPFPLVPDSYQASSKDQYSWLNIPKKTFLRSTCFGENENDVDNEKDSYLT